MNFQIALKTYLLTINPEKFLDARLFAVIPENVEELKQDESQQLLRQSTVRVSRRVSSGPYRLHTPTGLDMP